MNTTFSSSSSPVDIERVFDGIDETGILYVVTINGVLLLGALVVCQLRHHRCCRRRLTPSSAADQSIISVLMMSSQAVLQRAGTDGYLYLLFSKWLLMLYVLCTILSCGVLIPINMTASSMQPASNSNSTTVTGVRRTASASVGENSQFLWAHVVIVFLMSLAVYAFAWRFRRVRRQVLDDHRSLLLPATLDTVWIRGLPRDDAASVDNEAISAWLARRWPELRVRNVQVVADSRELSALYDRYKRCLKSRSHLADAEQRRLEQQLRGALGGGLPSTGHAFVRLHDRQLALDFLHRHWSERVAASRAAPEDAALCVERWTLHEATDPGDLIYDNLGVSRTEYYARVVIVNLVIVVFATFLTTPTAIWSGLTSIRSVAAWLRDWETSSRGSLLFEYAPSLALALISLVLPYAVLFSTTAEKHKTKSLNENVRLRKTFLFLFFYGMLLPSAALTSVDSFVRVLSDDPRHLASQLFPPDSGVFFLNYVVHVAFLFLAWDLSRPHEWTHQSTAIFDYGLNFSWSLLLWLITLVYSVFFPLITVAGLVCFVMRFATDKYLLCSVRVKQFDSNTPIVNTATYYVVFSVVMYQLAAAILCLDFGAVAQASVVLTFLAFLAVYVAWLLLRYRASRLAEKQRREELLRNWHREDQLELPVDGETREDEEERAIYQDPVVVEVRKMLEELDRPAKPEVEAVEDDEELEQF
jgi:hypothetical protein